MKVVAGWLEFRIEFPSVDEAKAYIQKHTEKNPDWYIAVDTAESLIVKVRRPWREYKMENF